MTTAAPTEQYFHTTPKLLAILQMAGAKGQLFTAKQVVNFLGAYIEKKELYDPDNKRIIRCKKDLLGEVFQVEQFVVTDFQNLWKLVFPCLYPATKREISSYNLVQNKNKSEDPTGLPWWYYTTARSGTVEDETEVGSYTGKETVGVCDTEDETDCEEFAEEYEPVDSDSDDSDSTIPVTSDEEEVPNFTGLQRFQTDSDDDTTTTEYSMDSEICLEELWTCSECRIKNVPTVGYCQCCWKMRKGWIKEKDFYVCRSLTEPPGCSTSISLHHSRPNVDIMDGRKRKSENTETEESPSSSQSSIVPVLPDFENPVKHRLEDAEEYGAVTRSKKLHLDETVKLHSDESVASSSSSSGTSSRDLGNFPGLCNICRNNPNDATIIHGNSGHQFCCYRCAKRLKKRGKTCPLCRQPIMLIIRNYIVQF